MSNDSITFITSLLLRELDSRRDNLRRMELAAKTRDENEEWGSSGFTIKDWMKTYKTSVMAAERALAEFRQEV